EATVHGLGGPGKRRTAMGTLPWRKVRRPLSALGGALAKTGVFGACSRRTLRGRNSSINTTPLTNPPTCAQNATPGSRAPLDRPLSSCIANHTPSRTQAGTVTIQKKMMIQTKQCTLARGYTIRYAPSTPAMAPLAPPIGTWEVGSTPAWISAAAAPQHK